MNLALSLASHISRRPHAILSRKTTYWDQISNMVVVGMFFWICIQNDSTANAFAGTVINTLQTTVVSLLNGTGY